MSRSKRYEELRKQVKPEAIPVEEALDVLLSTSKAKFDESAELHAHLGVDASKADQMVRLSTSLPNGTGKKVKIAAFVPENMEKEAKDAGAEIVGGDELIEKIKSTGKIEFETAVAHPAMMPKLAQIAKILGPKGLMPSPKTETISPKIGEVIKSVLSGKISVKMDEFGNLHAPFGKVSFGKEKLLANFNKLIEDINKARPKTIKGVYLKSLSIKSTMGPAIKVALK